MILEHALLPVSPGREAEFEASARAALPIIQSAPDCFGAEIRRQEENPSVYLLLVRWASIDAHMAFRASASFEDWRSRTHPFYSQPVTATHFHEPLEH